MFFFFRDKNVKSQEGEYPYGFMIINQKKIEVRVFVFYEFRGHD